MEAREDMNLTIDFPKGADWMNSGSLSLKKELVGKLVVLDFWTYCCINCIHVLPELARLEKKFGNGKETVFIGVHSAKFDTEKDTSNIRQAILRYDIEHSVVNDSEMTLWNHIGVPAWPTIVIISPKSFPFLTMKSGSRKDLRNTVVFLFSLLSLQLNKSVGRMGQNIIYCKSYFVLILHHSYVDQHAARAKK